MTVREYIGARYVPLFMGDWDNTNAYEPLSIVQYQGNSYTSRQSVPTGIDITNTAYWALTGNYNAQVEAYRQEVMAYDARITANTSDIATNTTDIAENAEAIATNTTDIAENAEAIATNTTDIAENAEAIAENAEAIAENTVEIEKVKGNSSYYNSHSANQNPQKILDTLKTYIEHAAQFSYGGSNIYRYNDNYTYGDTTLNENSKFPITCSPLVYLLVNGVEFDNSRYVNGTIAGGKIIGGDNKATAFGNVVNFNNDYGKRYWQRNRDGEIIDNAVFSEGFAHFLDDCGMLFPIYDNVNFTDLAIGDICFYETAREGDNPYYDTVFYYKDINHTDIYLGASNNYMYFASTSTNPAIQIVKRSINDEFLTKLKWHSRFNYGTSAAPMKLVDSALSLDYTGSAPYGYGNKTFANNVVIPQDRTLNTILIHLTEWTKNANLRISFIGSKDSETSSDTNALGRIYVDNEAQYIGNGWFYCVFDTEAIGIPVQSTDLNAVKLSVAGDSQFTVKADWMVMFNSLVQPSAGRNFVNA